MNDTLVNYVNFEMDELNSLSSDLYESLIDQVNEDVVKTAEEMIRRLRVIQQSHK